MPVYEEDYMGFRFSDMVPFFGVVEDNSDPLTLGRVRVRAFGFHVADKTAIPTEDLPWATAIQPCTSSSTSGVGWSPNGLERDSWVFGFFADGRKAQYPIILGSVPRITRPNPSEYPQGASGYSDTGQEANDGLPQNNAVYTSNPDSAMVSAAGKQQMHIVDPKGVTGRLTYASKSNWPLKIYSFEELTNVGTKGGSDHTAAESRSEGFINYATAVALENTIQEYGGQKVHINSGWRKRFGSPRHKAGRAFDLSVTGQANITRFVKIAVKNGFIGFGVYPSFIHIDTYGSAIWGADGHRATAPQWFIQAVQGAGWKDNSRAYGNVKGTGEVNQTTGGGNSGFVQTLLNAESRGGQDIYSGGTTKYGTASGYFQIVPPTWKEHGGSGSEAIGHSYAEQAAVAGRIQMRRWDPKTIAALRSAGYKVDLNKTLAENVAANGDSFGDGPSGGGGGGPMQGFNDPTNSKPYADTRGGPTTNEAAQGLNTGQVVSQEPGMGPTGVPGNPNNPTGTNSPIREAGQGPVGVSGNPNNPTGTPAPIREPGQGPAGAVKSVGSGELRNGGPNPISNVATTNGMAFGEPPDPCASQYPYNQVYTTHSGHKLQFDDTSGAENIAFIHGPSNSGIHIDEPGNIVKLAAGDDHQYNLKNSYHATRGDSHIHAETINLFSTTDVNVTGGGSMTMKMLRDMNFVVSGKLELNMGEHTKIKASHVIIEADIIDFRSNGNCQLHALGELSICGDNGVMVQSGKYMHVLAKDEMLMTSSDGKMHVSSKDDMKVTSEAKMHHKATGEYVAESTGGEVSIKAGKSLTTEATGGDAYHTAAGSNKVRLAEGSGKTADTADKAKTATPSAIADSGPAPGISKSKGQHHPGATSMLARNDVNYTG